MEFFKQIYDWLIRPAEVELESSGVQTVVFFMDGLLRNMPASALYDGQQYLLEKYSIALTPGLQLLEPLAIAPEQFALITGGISDSRQGFSAFPAVESEVKQSSGITLAECLPNRTRGRSRSLGISWNCGALWISQYRSQLMVSGL